MTDDNEQEIEQEATEAETGENGTGEEALELTDEAEEESEAEPEKPKGKSVQDRFDEITAARREAERDAEYWRSKALEKQPEKQPEPTVEDAEPDPVKYEFGEADPAYLKDVVRFEMKQELAKERQQMQIQNTLRDLDTGYAQRVAAVKEEIPDYDEVVTQSAKAGKWPCPPLVALAAKESPVGPKILHHLATNKAEAIALANLSPIEQAMEFGRLSAQFAGQTAPQAKIATNAPEPAPARTKGGQFAPSGVLDDRLSTEDWFKRREAQIK
jgi:hypothetical protein